MIQNKCEFNNTQWLVETLLKILNNQDAWDVS